MATLITPAPSAAQLEESHRVPLQSQPDVPPLPANFATGVVNGGFFFRQPTPATTWTVIHNLGRYPSVTVSASIGEAALVEVEAEVWYVNENECLIQLRAPGEGWVWLR